MSIFREYDIRGIFEVDLTKEVVTKIGYLLGEEIKKYDSKVAIGYDARTHSPTLFEWLCYGLQANGLEVFNLGMIPTPVAYYCTFNTDIKSSIMITGSHNPPQYNGFKITINKAPFYGKQIEEIGKKMESAIVPHVTLKDSVKLNVLESYIDYMTKEFATLRNFKEKIVFDCGNGVAGIALAKIIENLDLQIVPLFFEPDGTFPNHHPDPSEEHNLIDIHEALKTHNAHIGIAFDGDADRVALISQNHNFKGDELAILFARDIAKTIDSPTIIGEVKCSQVMYDYINAIGKSVMYKTGHSNLKVKLKELNAQLACEMSGHIFFNDRYFGYDDAIYAALRILELIYKENQTHKNLQTPIATLEDTIKSLPKLYSTQEEKIHTDETQKFHIIARLQDDLQKILKEQKEGRTTDFPEIIDIISIDGVRVVFKDGWGLVRASNTTPTLVTRFEAYTKEKLSDYKQVLLHLIQH
ncbi:phosphomannomutase/phosphoglucomutase [Helicobacter trogontum]|uniref:Phosphomannomutase/phosphoglucomutase n=1 Tax=Helicobacter trogontum TaxID=50960 RepID=A0A4U8SCI8_9HELI|nr:phosphomannomutase/phosphoglucomutase [Helicobacter trogontum]TLD83814.1 phosphomannomutase/phosphoglucomutase [Helicobacter trogontum]